MLEDKGTPSRSPGGQGIQGQGRGPSSPSSFFLGALGKVWDLLKGGGGLSSNILRLV